MVRIVFLVLLLNASAVAKRAFSAEPLTLDLWPGKPPGDVGIEGQESSRMYESALLDKPTKLITNVSRPTITVYLAPKKTNTGTAMLICPSGGYHNLFWELEFSDTAYSTRKNDIVCNGLQFVHRLLKCT